MNRCKLCVSTLSLLFVLISNSSAFAQTIIAHRGLFHNSVNADNFPENSAEAVKNANNSGMAGVEVDLREASDGVVMVTHDQISNRTTTDDNDGGQLNPVYVAIGSQNSVSPISISSQSSGTWSGKSLKMYVAGANNVISPYNMMTLDNFLSTVSGDPNLQGSFKIILDIQNPDIFSKAALAVTAHGLQKNVYLKFFAKSALYNNLTYNGAFTCYQYMEANHLNDPKLQIIPQINDGELDMNEDDNAGITIWGTTFTIPEYLNCWSSTMQDHVGQVATMPIVSASVPTDNSKATTAATAALNWAKSNGRQTMSIIPNPDACYVDGNAARQYSFSSTSVAANPFNNTARAAKAGFVSSNNPTYVIEDAMGLGSSWTVNSTYYNNGLCNGSN